MQAQRWTPKTNDGDTPLHRAARFGQPATVQLLIHEGADTFAKNQYDQIPLNIAETEGYTEIVKTLTTTE